MNKAKCTDNKTKQFSLCFVALHASPLFYSASRHSMVGGAEVQQYFLGKELAQIGMGVKFIVKEDPLLTEKEKHSIELIRAYDPSKGIRFVRGIYPQFIKLWNALVRADCDVYYVRGAKYESGIVWLYCKAYKKLMIQALAHDYDCSFHTLHNLKGKVKKNLYIQALKGADLVLAQTSAQQILLRKNLNVQSYILPNLMNLAGKNEPVSKGGIRKVLWIATIKPIKRPYMYLELARVFPELTFTMIGPRSDKFDVYRGEFIAEANKVSNLQFVDYVSLENIEKYFKDSDIFISTSKKEGFPNVFSPSMGVWKARYFICGP